MGAKPSLTADQLSVGRVYASKRPKAVGVISRYYDDRQILYIGKDRLTRASGGSASGIWVQYDSPTVRFGKKFPKTTLEKFLKWVGADVTDQCPPGEWRIFPDGERQAD